MRGRRRLTGRGAPPASEAYALLIQQATLFAYVGTFRWLALRRRRVTRRAGPVAAH